MEWKKKWRICVEKEIDLLENDVSFAMISSYVIRVHSVISSYPKRRCIQMYNKFKAEMEGSPPPNVIAWFFDTPSTSEALL